MNELRTKVGALIGALSVMDACARSAPVGHVDAPPVVHGQHAVSSAAASIAVTVKPRPKEQIRQVLHHANRLWLLDDDGNLRSLDDTTHVGQAYFPDRLVVEIHRTLGGELLALTSGRSMRDVRVWAYVGDDWKLRAAIGNVTSAPIALGEVAGDPLVLTFDTAYRVRGSTVLALTLNPPLSAVIGGDPSRIRMHMATASELAYVGADKGEWGGGLDRIDLRTGRSEALRSVDGKWCGGDYNPGCHPVTAIVPDPSHAECVLVGVGLAHMSMEVGKVLRVCDRAMTVAWTAPSEPDFAAAWVFARLIWPKPEGRSKCPPEKALTGCSIEPDAEWWNTYLKISAGTQPVDDLASAQDGVWLATPRVLYFSSGGAFVARAQPSPWQTFDGVTLAASSTLSLVKTHADSADPLTIYTPLVAPHDAPTPNALTTSPIGRCFVVRTGPNIPAKICFERTRWVTTLADQTSEGPASWTVNGDATTLTTTNMKIDFHPNGELLIASRTDASQMTHEATISPLSEHAGIDSKN